MLHLAHRDMVREGDGNALVSMWKIHMLQFWNRGHTHYKMIGHQFLACKESLERKLHCVLHEMTHMYMNTFEKTYVQLYTQDNRTLEQLSTNS